MAPVLGYWNVRGLGTPIRLLLEYAGVEHEEKLYKCGPPPDFERAEWLNEKFNLGLDFPNLPYYIDGDVKITQSRVILRYLGKKCGLMGKNDAEQLRVDLLDTQLADYQAEFVKLVYNPSFLELKENYIKGLADKLKALADFLGDRKFAAGDYVTYADFVLFEYLDVQSSLVNGLLKDYPALDQFHKRILALEAIDKYWQSPRAIKYPINGAPAYYGGEYSDQLLKQ